MDGVGPLRLTRRQLLRAAGLTGATMLAASCGRSFGDVRLTIATGGTQGVGAPIHTFDVTQARP